MNNLENRALAAYFRTAASAVGAVASVNPPGIVQEVATKDGLRYVVLSNVNGILAVYRVRIVNGDEVLKGLKRYPRELDTMFGGI